ncbi:MAG: alpha/beta fold hydrolase [Candidatus Wallbacteria bacterium]|nr:alpha/beta fold hydrolase [Candidatus Wallbacteria bacterium]
MTADLAPFRHIYPFESHFLELDGRKLHYLDEGPGEPMLMLHGNPTWSFFYRNLVLGLRGSRRCIVPDHMGCGLSDKPQDYPYTATTHIENLERLVERLELERITLVLHDWGGLIGLGFARRHPGLVRRIVLLNTAAWTRPPGLYFPVTIRSCRFPGFGQFAIRGLNLFCLAALQWAINHSERLTPDVRAGFLAPYDSWANRVAVHRFVADIPFTPADPAWAVCRAVEDDLPRFRDRPMLILWGMRDFCFHPGFLERWLTLCPQAAVERYDDAGHYVLEDAHERIVPRIARFLEENPLP